LRTFLRRARFAKLHHHRREPKLVFASSSRRSSTAGGNSSTTITLDQLEQPACATALSWSSSRIEQLAQARALHMYAIIMKTKKTLKLTMETLRRLDLDGVGGGVHHHPHKPPTGSLGASCGIGCLPTDTTLGPPTHSFGPSCGIGCFPHKPKTVASCGVALCKV
jgi:hypothetical protein